MFDEREEISGLILGERCLSSQAIKDILMKGGYTPFNLTTIHGNLTQEKHAVVVVLAKYFPVRDDGTLVCLVSDLQGNIAQLILNGSARSQLSSRQEGDLLLLVNPSIEVNRSKGYSLRFKIENQLDVMIVGSCKYFSRCIGLRKDGKPCTIPVDTSVSTLCKYHQNSTNLSPAKGDTTPIPKPNSLTPKTSLTPKQSDTNLDTFLCALQQAPKTSHSFQSLSQKSSSFGGFDFLEEEAEKSTGVVSIPPQSKIFNPSNLGTSRKAVSSTRPITSTAQSTNAILQVSSKAPIVRPPRATDLESKWKIRTQGLSDKLKQSESERSLKERNQSLVAIGDGNHSVLLSLSKLQKNSMDTPSQNRKRPRETSQTISQSEIDELLIRQSVNENVAREEWTDSFVSRLKTLEKREELIHKDEEVTSIAIRASHCLTCNRYAESTAGLEICRKNRHQIVIVSTKKYFYECQGCGRRDSVIGSQDSGPVGPSYPCNFCKQINWRLCGKNKSGAVVAGSKLAKSAESRENGLVVAFSSETSRRDRDRIQALHSSLDHTAR